MTEAPKITRKLTTILAADAANYSGRMAQDEVGTVQALRRSRAVIDRTITERGGRIANTSGDGLIAEFPSVVEAVAAAVTIQRDLYRKPELLPFRLGLHLGDVIVEGTDLLGDGVNRAARLQENAPEGGIFVSAQIVDHAKGRLDAEFRPLGPAALKHLGEEVAIYGVVADGIAPPDHLERVVPQVRARRQDTSPEPDLRARVMDSSPGPAPVPDSAPDLPDTALDSERKKFNRTARACGIAAAALVIFDLAAGDGPGWPLLAVAVLALVLFRKWRKLPPRFAGPQEG